MSSDEMLSLPLVSNLIPTAFYSHFSGYTAGSAATSDLNSWMPQTDPVPAIVPGHGQYVLCRVWSWWSRCMPRWLWWSSHVPG